MKLSTNLLLLETGQKALITDWLSKICNFLIMQLFK